MENVVLLSIIIPNYNKGKLLKRCLDSLLNQDLSRVEIILLDDCSTDCSKDILSNYKNINIIFNSVNKGICKTRNIGIELAKGEYITFLDSDDYVTDDYIFTIKEALKTNREFYVFDVKKYKDDTLKREYTCSEQGLMSMEEYIKKNPKEYLKAHISYWVWNKIFKKNIIEDNQILFEAFDCEDEDFTSRYMLCIEYIYFMNKQLYNYCVNETSATERKNINYAEPFRIVSTNNINMFDKFDGNLDIIESEIIKMFEVGYQSSSSEDDKEQLIKNKEELIKRLELKRNK